MQLDGTVARLFDDAKALTATWENDWVSVDSGPLSIERLKQNPSNPSEWDPETFNLFEIDLNQKWLEFLFFPGRFTTATLEHDATETKESPTAVMNGDE